MIIGLGYKARSGKDTVADYLRVHFGFKHVAFADALKDACRAIFHLNEHQLYGDQKDVEDAYWKDTPRNILQRVGTECLRRGYDTEVWVKSLGHLITRDLSSNWVISDVRFPNEALAVKGWGGVVVLVDRPNAPEIKTNQHASETSMESWGSWDYLLRNHGDLPELCAKVELMMKDLQARVDFTDCQPMKAPVVK